MNADARRARANEISSKVLECAFKVSNALGSGFLEKVYDNALAVELRNAGIPFSRQKPFQVRYREEIVGEYVPDLVVADTLIVEVKALDSLARVHQAQCMNYLRVTGLRVGLLLNFGTPRLEVKRLVWEF